MKETSQLEQFDKMLKGKISGDRVLAESDRWQLAHSCKGFYASLSNDLLKHKLYSSGIIPLGLLDHAIFKQYPPNLAWLCDFFHKRKSALSKIHLDYRKVWPLVALMGMEEALDQVLAQEEFFTEKSACKDPNGFSPLFYIAMGGHQEQFQRWIEKYYPYFTKETHPELLDVVTPICGDERFLRFLMDTYGYTLHSLEFYPSLRKSLFDMLKYGYQTLFWGQMEVLAQNGVIISLDEGIPVIAAEHKQWTLADELLGELLDAECELSEEQQGMLVCYAARDDHERFLELLEVLPDIDFSQFNFNGNNVYTLACEGGNQKTVDFILEKGWFSETEPNYKISRATGTMIAAQCGHLKLIDYFYNRFGEAIDQRDPDNRDLLDYAAMHGDWFKFQHLVKTFRPKGWVPPVPNIDEKSPLNYAASHGRVYFAQQFILMYGTEYFKNPIKELEGGNRTMSDWVVEQSLRYDGNFLNAMGFAC